MNAMTLTIMSYSLRGIARSKWLILYAGFFFAATEGLLRLSGDPAKASVSLLNVTLLLIPLVSMLFGTTYFYNNREFIEFLLSQPVKRFTLFSGLYGGLTTGLCAAFLLGAGVPFMFDGASNVAAVGTMIMAGVLLTLIFSALAFLLATRFEDKAQGLGAALMLWLFCAVLYDGLVLLGVWFFQDYPLEMPMIALSIANPIDLARILVMLKFDIAALMGYTGAVFEKFFGSTAGVAITLSSLFVWAIAPFAVGARLFARKNF